MKVLVTGNQGYIGSVLVDILLEKGYDVVGYDIGYYKDCQLFSHEPDIVQITKDIRDITVDDVKGFDAVIHLAALSNDPLGDLAPGLTEEINLWGTIRTATAAKKSGVKRFVYASSQSMYGISKIDAELDEDLSEKHPITSYARTKWEAECELKRMTDKEFHVTCFRPSTVFGASPRLRCDIVYNNLVGCAYSTGRIEILSDGTPWRPVVHVRDVSNAFIAGLEAPLSLVSGESFNVGIPNGNFTVRDLAEAAQRSVPGCELVFTGDHGNDSRSYQVSFRKILTVLKDYFKPEWDLDRGGQDLARFFKMINFTENDFRGRRCTRIKQIKYLQESHKLGADLRFIGQVD
jgi:nucleoside-diphosphate-sugar epimerase